MFCSTKSISTAMKQSYVSPLDVNSLADQAHMSPTTFRRRFRTVTGTSPLPARSGRLRYKNLSYIS